jgi:hypothetical protein
VLRATVQVFAVGIMWSPYVPAGTCFPATVTGLEKVMVVFSLAPARHGSS